MLSLEEAKAIATKDIPNGRPQSVTPMGDLFVFVIFGEADSIESEMDPYFSVNRKTKEFKEFSLTQDTTPAKFIEVFQSEGIVLAEEGV